MTKTQIFAIGALLTSVLFTSLAHATTWCPATNIKDVICYSDKSCFVTADAYGGIRYYLIAATDENKNAMLAIALTALTTKSRARIAFTQDNLNCNDVPLGSSIYGVGATE